MSIGWNPVFKNKERTAEPWILHDFGGDFYGQHIRLVVCGYIRWAGGPGAVAAT
jgi:riboflavin kinase